MKFTKCVRPEKDRKEHTMKNKGIIGQLKNVKEEIIGQNRAVSMPVLHELYGLEIGDCRYRHTLLQEYFTGQFIFPAPKPTKTEASHSLYMIPFTSTIIFYYFINLSHKTNTILVSR